MSFCFGHLAKSKIEWACCAGLARPFDTIDALCASDLLDHLAIASATGSQEFRGLVLE